MATLITIRPGRDNRTTRHSRRLGTYYIVPTNPVDRLDVLVALHWLSGGFAIARKSKVGMIPEMRTS